MAVTRRRRSGGLSRRQFYVFIVLTALGIGLLLLAQAPGWRRLAVSDRPLPTGEITAALPAGAQSGDRLIVPLMSVAPAYAVGYNLGGEARLGLVLWNRATSSYYLDKSWSAADGFGGSWRVESLDFLGLGPAAPFIVRTTLTDGGRRLVCLATSREIDLAAAKITSADGGVRPACFDETAFRWLDIDGNNLFDIVLEPPDDGREVYVWDGALFDYSPTLSWGLKVSRELFPEPGVAPSP